MHNQFKLIQNDRDFVFNHTKATQTHKIDTQLKRNH